MRLSNNGTGMFPPNLTSHNWVTSIPLKTRWCVIGVLGVAHFSYGSDVPFDELVASPARFNRHRVTVKGLAEVGGDDFDLWRDTEARKRVDIKQHIFVAQRFDQQPRNSVLAPYRYANLRWVKVTGMVDTSFHGRFGMDPFALWVKRVQMLSGPRERQFLPIIGYFKNETSNTISINGSWRGGGVQSGAGPGGIDCFAIGRGWVAVTVKSGKPIGRCDLMPPRLVDQYYDRQKKAYFFRITDRAVQPVLPPDAKSWNLGDTMDRD
jgi:hypothetical protein